MTTALPEMTVEELKSKMDAKADIFLLDVREPNDIPDLQPRRTLDPHG